MRGGEGISWKRRSRKSIFWRQLSLSFNLACCQSDIQQQSIQGEDASSRPLEVQGAIYMVLGKAGKRGDEYWYVYTES